MWHNSVLFIGRCVIGVNSLGIPNSWEIRKGIFNENEQYDRGVPYTLVIREINVEY